MRRNPAKEIQVLSSAPIKSVIYRDSGALRRAF
jgi:hypothetical protein